MIIGLGTGRCGTVSLSKLFKKANLNVTHELAPVVNWDAGDAQERLQYLTNKCVDGDVAFWYLNLVEGINEICEDVYFVCLERSIEEVVDSYNRKTSNRNHWIHHDGTIWLRDTKWDPCFPKYDVTCKLQAIRLYCEEYRKRALEYQEKMDNFKIFNIDALNSKEGIQSIFNFLNLDVDVVEDMVNIRLNKA